MGVRTMVSPNRVQAPHFLPQTRQGGSQYDLNFDEVQTQMGNVGKPMDGMNLDELLKNVISAEEGHDQLMQNQSSPLPPSSFFFGNFNLNGTLSRKMVSEVWKEIVHREPVNGGGDASFQQQLALGETALKDFPVHAGVLNERNQDGILDPHPLAAIDPMVGVSQPADWLKLQMAAVQQHQQMTALDSNFHVSESVFPGVDAKYSENQEGMSVPMPAIAAGSSESQADVERKHRFSDGTMEKTIERRQRRMIKNRESAARSRARKQAYTNQLEHQVLQLRKTNSRLRKQKEVMMFLSSDPTPVPKYQLRRTSSVPF